MKKTRLLKRVVVLVLCVTLILSMTACTKKSEVSLGTGGVGGNYYSYGTGLAEMLVSETNHSMEVVNTEGSAANLRLISQGYLDMAMVQSDTLKDAIYGTGNFSAPLTGFHIVSGLYTESCQIVVAAESNIETVDDLYGKKVSLGEEDSGTLRNAKEILSAFGMDGSNVNTVYLSYQDSAEALKNGEIDGFFVTASAPTTAIASLSEEMDIRILDLKDAVSWITRKNSSYYKNVIPAGTYKGQEEDIHTVGVVAVLIASDNIDPEIENTVASILSNRNEELKEISFGVVTKEKEEGILTVAFDMYMTLGLAVLVLYLGNFLKKKIKLLETFCIPAPVIGGLIFAVISCILYVTGVMEFTFDETLKTICMVIFFTSVGFQANIKVLRKGGISLVIFLVCVIVLIFSQNGIAVGLSSLLGVSPLVGMCTGSIPMVGGHGTSGAFGIVLEDLGLNGATSLCTAAATFGLIMGSLMGGPIGRRLIIKKDLLKTVVKEDDSILVEEEQKQHRSVSMYAPAAYQIAIAMGIGTIVSLLLSKTGMTFPIYIGAMIVAAIMRNIGEFTGKIKVHMGEINDIGGICLSLFLGIAMVTLKIWQLAELALPLFILLIVQTVFMALFSYFVVYNVMGRNYDAAVLAAGTCGFGMGATPNAMANMQAITEKYAPSVQAYLLVPIVGSMFADFINSLVITLFINMI